ncbi:hypothetical protein TEA_024942 [Camellia sinensis var. sinensis]|uniref:Shikimate kinase n=1 Tax=Camellia sinensis var. sinensis TaxID=542762 RepID=A0A4S4D0J3_CAMSN|nr:hypothetical protein TEA_024942 [Camellia sinensis var. sinensis]
MEVKLAQSLQFSTWIDLEKMVMKPSGSLQFSRRSREQKRFQILISSHLQPTRTATATATATATSHKPVALKVSCSYKNLQGSVLQSGSFPASFDEALILKNKSEEIEPYLNGRCIYLVGMMGSGKTTIGRILSDVLGYSFFDCDAMIEQTVGGTSVAEIFKLYGESFFRDNEVFYMINFREEATLIGYDKTEVLRKLTMMQRLVVSTGGGAVIRPINWKHMQKGISVWLDVPLEALARRIAAVGTGSRPLLHQEAGDAYSKAFMRLSTLLEERSEAYANANARVSLENIASKLGCIDVCNLTPTVIVIEALEQIDSFLKK